MRGMINMVMVHALHAVLLRRTHQAVRSVAAQMPTVSTQHVRRVNGDQTVKRTVDIARRRTVRLRLDSALANVLMDIQEIAVKKNLPGVRLVSMDLTAASIVRAVLNVMQTQAPAMVTLALNQYVLLDSLAPAVQKRVKVALPVTHLLGLASHQQLHKSP
jgi:hypothetical protein